jgi:hypothetical protein
LPAKADIFSGLGFLVKLCLGDTLRAIEEFMAKRIEIFLRGSGHCSWRLDLETGHKAR